MRLPSLCSRLLRRPSRNQATLAILLGALLPLLALRPASAIVVLQVSQVGDSVVVNGTGSANLLELTFDEDSNTWSNLLTNSEIYAGPAANGDGAVSLYSGLTGPSAISTAGLLIPDGTSSGDLFGLFIDAGIRKLVLPQSYSSGSELSGQSIFTDTTLAELGLPSGTTIWSWGSGDNADSLELRVDGIDPDAVPSPLPLAGAAAAFSWSRRLRRRIQLQTGNNVSQ